MGNSVEKEKILVTSALPYANGPIHLGHLAGAYLPADVYVRYHRLKGSDVLYICGSDEHGVPITITADKENVSPNVVIDRFHDINKKSFDKFGMKFDIYSRTSIPVHHKTAQEFFTEYYNRGLLNEKKTMQFYDNKAKMFLPDRYVEGTCPNCGNENARSDECENCGALYDPSDLKNPVSKISGDTPVLKETSHWYFPLGEYQDWLEKYIVEMDETYNWKENVLQYCRGWFKDGLKDRAYTRDLDWGVKVPLENANGKVLYVWFEAVLGYISATIELSEKRGDKDLWKRFWQDTENTKYVAFIGKDNVVFHCIIFPAMLKAWNQGQDEKYVYPQNVPANEFLNFEGKKFSKSRNWSIDVIDFLEKFQADSLRYTLALNLPELRDTDFYWKDFQARHNNELADILGNFVNRTFTFTFKHFEGKVPELHDLNEKDSDMLNLLEGYPKEVSELIEKYKIKDATVKVMNLARAANKYFNDSEPWKAVKTDKNRCGTILNISLQTIYTLAELFQPFIPFASEKMMKMLNADYTDWFSSGKYQIQEGHQLNKPELLFTKIEDSVIDEMVAQLGKGSEDDKEKANIISFDEFKKVEMKAAKIISAEPVPKSKKLLKVIVSLGNEERQIIAGISNSYSPEELVGKKVLVVANLQPAKLMGHESQGMILALDIDGGKVKLIEVNDEVKEGTIAK